jgi:BirA family biotin operon repressor/biotin-[acetyl-CoA-carboxylase] ligase
MISGNGHLTILESVDSTNNYAMGELHAGRAGHGDGFFAMEQTQGKGQRGKTWLTEPGSNIILTLTMKLSDAEPLQPFQLNAAVALGVFDFFSAHAGDETTIKWPNDIYWRDRKAGGILIENIKVQGLLAGSWMVVGMGININQTSFPALARRPVSLKQITGKQWDVLALVEELRAAVGHRFNQYLQGGDLRLSYNELLYKKGQRVRFKSSDKHFTATVLEVDERGDLVLFAEKEERFRFGELEWVD